MLFIDLNPSSHRKKYLPLVTNGKWPSYGLAVTTLFGTLMAGCSLAATPQFLLLQNVVPGECAGISSDPIIDSVVHCKFQTLGFVFLYLGNGGSCLKKGKENRNELHFCYILSKLRLALRRD